MIKLSAVIITYNEEFNIRRCIESIIDIVDEIVIVDSFSSDRTKEICMEFDLNSVHMNQNGLILNAWMEPYAPGSFLKPSRPQNAYYETQKITLNPKFPHKATTTIQKTVYGEAIGKFNRCHKNYVSREWINHSIITEY